MSTLEESEEATCSICLQEYGTERVEEVISGTTEQSGTSEEFDGQGLPGGEALEYPVKLSCGHVYGEWCIKRWLLEQPASCPKCRFQLKLVAR